MAAGLRFSITNLAEAATIKNGTGGGPARDEVSPRVMERALSNDSLLTWQGTATGDVDIALGSAQTIQVLGALGHRGAPSTAVGIASIVPKYQTGANYLPGNPWTSFPSGTLTLGLGKRRAAVVLASAVANVTFIRFSITATTGFLLGRWWAGALDIDLGILSSRGRLRTHIYEERRTAVAGNPSLDLVGDPRYRYELPYGYADDTLFAKLQTVAQQNAPILMIERDDSAEEVIRSGPEFGDSLWMDAPNARNATLYLDTLG